MINWEVHDDLYFSDHYDISITILAQNQKQPRENYPKWIIDKVNWQLYRKTILQSDFSDITFDSTSPIEIDTIPKIFTDFVMKSAAESIPKSPTKIPKTIVPWWCEELKLAIRERKRALRKFKKNRTLENLINFKQKRAFSRQLDLSKQRESFKKFMSLITQNPSTKETWEKIRILKGSFTPASIPSIRHKNKIITTEDIANVLVQNFANVSANDSFNPQIQL